LSERDAAAVKSRSNAEWLAALKSTGVEQAAALGDLREHVLRAALFALGRRRGTLGLLSAAEINHLAEDCAQEALLAILQHLDRFRGESRFTTWAYSFGINTALVAARRERWQRVPLEGVLDAPDIDGWSLSPERVTTDPARRALQEETLAAIRDAIEHDLTERQRQALKAIVFEGVPLDELARHWQSNRNAIYKLVHDARRKLKTRLEARGLSVAETLGLFGAAR
jgi:RNA polymerase sigma-70 factor, ECF subfamily